MTSPSRHPRNFPDPFAVEWGHDEYGTFQSFAVGSVVQRMRWIPPGSFLMGSPENEVGRFEDELQHRVTLSRGLWLADSPVTQELWQLVMGTYPSQFKQPTQPVEPVSWEDCQLFFKRLNQGVAGLDARLPTEEEWEYACRAGTTTATWVGDLLTGEESEAQVLESIGWYIGNSCGTTHPVAQKQPNPWGIYDMLGNVWEWCQDNFDYYANDPALLNEVAVEVPYRTRGLRVLRGGSWYAQANFLRAACRYANKEDFGSNAIGLRLARSPTRT